MRKTIVAGVVLAALVLGGCTPMLERSETTVQPHVQFSDEREDPSVLRAEGYQGLVSALLHLVAQGEEQGTIRLYQYLSVTGSAASDVDQACLEVTQEDPMGAYAVDYIKYDVGQTASYYQVDVKLAYTRTKEEIAQVISVTGSSAVERELRDLVGAHPDRAVFRISYWTGEDSASSIRRAAEDACGEDRPRDIAVTLYPDSGTQRVVEIVFDWPENVENNA